MLINEPGIFVECKDPILSMLAAINNRSLGPVKIAQGVYTIGHFGSSHFLRDYGYDCSPDLGPFNPYGVCDSYEDILTQCPEIDNPRRKFIICLTLVKKADEPSQGGWRWHKWGPYIGKHEITREYLADEPLVEQVYCYHVYEKDPVKYTYEIACVKEDKSATKTLRVQAKNVNDAWLSARPGKDWDFDYTKQPVIVS